MDIIGKVKELVQKMNEAGIPVPLVRLNGAPTITGTMVFLSFTTAWLGQLGKMAKILGPVDLTQANYLFGICLAAYLGRKMQGNKDNVTIDKDETK